MKIAREPTRSTAIVRSELKATVNLREAVARQRAEVDADMAAAVSAAVRSGSTGAFEKSYARAQALADLAGRLVAAEAALRSELSDTEAWDRAAPEREQRAAAEAERQRLNAHADNAVAVVEAAIRRLDPKDAHWRTRGQSPVPADAVLSFPGVRRGSQGEPYAVVFDRAQLDGALEEHRETLVRGGAQAVADVMSRSRAIRYAPSLANDAQQPTIGY